MKVKVKFGLDAHGRPTWCVDGTGSMGLADERMALQLFGLNGIEIEVTEVPEGWQGLDPTLAYPARIRTLPRKGTGRFGTGLGGGMIPGSVDGGEEGWLVRWDDDESESWVQVDQSEPVPLPTVEVKRIRTLPPEGTGRFGTVIKSDLMRMAHPPFINLAPQDGYLVRWDDDHSESWMPVQECREVNEDLTTP